MVKQELHKKKKVKIVIISVLSAVILLTGVLTYMGLDMSHSINYAARYTEAQHLERVGRRVEKYFMTEESGYTGYQVYPLYDENEKLSYFLVEFEPVGFVYIKLYEYHSEIIRMYGMYAYDNAFEFYKERPWRRYRYFHHAAVQNEDGTWEEPIPYPEIGWKFDSSSVGAEYEAYKRWEVNENGEFTYYRESHFKAANVLNEKRYFLELENGCYFVPAVKRGDKWLNLVSMEQFVIDDYSNCYVYIKEQCQYFLPATGTYFWFKYSKDLW